MWTTTSKVVSVTNGNIGLQNPFTPNDPDGYLSAEHILKKSLQGQPDLVLLSGVQPLKHPGILKIVKALKVAKIRPGIATNGIAFADTKITASIKSAGLAIALVVLPGLSGPTYKDVCGVDQWSSVRKGLYNLRDAGIEIVLDVPAFLTNLLSIQHVLALGKELGHPDIRFFYPQVLKKKQIGHYPGLYPHLELTATAVQVMAEQYKGQVTASGIPMCFPLHGAKRVKSPAGDSLLWESHTEKLQACSECSDRNNCHGVPTGYIELHGTPVNGPIVKTVSSSFDFVDTGHKTMGTPEPGPDCFALSITPNQEIPEKSVLIKAPNNGVTNNWGLFVTKTGDFTPKEIRHIVKKAGQLYMDKSTGPDVTDFATELVRLGMEKACEKCRMLGQCPGCFTPVLSPAFQEEIRLIADLISKMQGRILDVGAGEGYYRDTIRSMVNAGTVEYHAMDPQEDALEKLLTALPQTITHLGAIETIGLSAAGFDNIIAIRSVNHFKSLHHAFTNITTMLKTGGDLLVTDGLALPLARTRDKAVQSHTLAKGGFQHYRNISSQEFIKFLSAYPFKVIFHRPLGRHTSDEWIVHAKKTA